MSMATTNLRRAILDYDTTTEGAAELRNALAQPGLSRERRDSLRRRAAAATALGEARAEQVSRMPDGEIRESAKDQLKVLALAREELAYLRAEAAGSPPSKELKEAIRGAEDAAFQADVRFRSQNAGWAYDREHVLADEVEAFPHMATAERRDLVELSHLRATVSDGGHDARFERVSAARERDLHRRVFQTRGEVAPAPYEHRKKGGVGKYGRRRGRSFASYLSGSRRRNPAAEILDPLLDATPGKQMGEQLIPDAV